MFFITLLSTNVSRLVGKRYDTLRNFNTFGALDNKENILNENNKSLINTVVKKYRLMSQKKQWKILINNLVIILSSISFL